MTSPSNFLRISALLLCLLPVGCEPDSALVERLAKLEEQSSRFQREAAASQKQAEIWKAEVDKLRAQTPAPAPAASTGSSPETDKLVAEVRDELRALHAELKVMKASMEKTEHILWNEERPVNSAAAAQPAAPTRPQRVVPADTTEIRWPEEQGRGAPSRPAPGPAPGPRPTPQPRTLPSPEEGGPPGGGGDGPIRIEWPEER